MNGKTTYNEQLTIIHLVGSITILIGVYFTNYLSSNSDKNLCCKKDTNLDVSKEKRVIPK
ncbi:hypothetical protein HF847_07160 [Clostridium cochlearium]|uniref:hypothetical protein n=1 Tax=Clostridium cochlearium TaxID=1494 RepID=UPI001459C9B3|nr:hypothetical protein [Clostridium cochlearium]NME95773.1 hypothetical protein [Clostridium cochlearium]